MDERQREDMIQGIVAAIEKNCCAIKREDLYKKFGSVAKISAKDIIK